MSIGEWCTSCGYHIMAIDVHVGISALYNLIGYQRLSSGQGKDTVTGQKDTKVGQTGYLLKYVYLIVRYLFL